MTYSLYNSTGHKVVRLRLQVLSTDAPYISRTIFDVGRGNCTSSLRPDGPRRRRRRFNSDHAQVVRVNRSYLDGRAPDVD